HSPPSPPPPTLFPYTTLFRSRASARSVGNRGRPERARVAPANRADRGARLSGPRRGGLLSDVPESHRLRADPHHVHRHGRRDFRDRKSTRLNSSHRTISYAVF